MVDHALLGDPLRNKETAFTRDERVRLGLLGVLPDAVETMEQQLDREYARFRSAAAPIDQHIQLRELQDRNEVLFYRLVGDHLAEMLPIIYTPTVGEACQRFSHLYRHPRGLFLGYPDRGRLREVLRNRRSTDIDVVVVTDGQRILGLGDQGVGGMGIPIGKLSLYTAVGGIDPSRTLPIVLDVGTDDPARLADPAYLGWRHPRVTGADYLEFVDEFVAAVRDELPGTLLQWEDFAIDHAEPILATYRDQLLTFNDDIQGTAAVVLATVLSGCRITGRPLPEHRVTILGAGSAAIGVAGYLERALVESGLGPQEALDRIALVDVQGLVHRGRDDLSASQRHFARDADDATRWDRHGTGAPDLEDVVTGFGPTVLIGLSTAGGAFTQSVVAAMTEHADSPIILPLSNPSSRSEADPADVLDWTEGRALVATGSPYPRVAQCNNAFVFPAMGLAVVAAEATRVSDGMFLAAAASLAQTAAGSGVGPSLLPAVDDLPQVARTVALAVAERAVSEGLAPRRDTDELAARIEEIRWSPRYRTESG